MYTPQKLSNLFESLFSQVIYGLKLHWQTDGARMYGAAMLALGALCVIVTAGNWHSRRAVRITLIVQGLFFVFEVLGTYIILVMLTLFEDVFLTTCPIC